MNNKGRRPPVGQDKSAARSDSKRTLSSTRDDVDAAAQLAMYFRCAFVPDDLIEIRRLPSGRSTWHKAADLARLANALCRENQANENIYVGIGPRRAEGGTKDIDVDALRVLVADFDGGVTPDQALGRWRAARLPAPTLIITSGHGTHIYLRLEVPIDAESWRGWQKGLARLLDSDPSIHNPSRLMRLPGFLNLKDPARPEPCTIVQSDPGASIELADLHEIIPQSDQVPTATPPAESTNGDGRLFAAALTSLLRIVPTAPEHDGSRRLLAWACRAVEQGLSDADAVRAIRILEHGFPFPRHYTDAEIRHRLRDARKRDDLRLAAPPTDSLPDTVPSWYSVAEVFAYDEYHRGLPTIPTTYENVDTILGGGLRAECVYYLGGRTGSAKSTLAANIARRVALHGSAVLLFKLEESLAEVVYRIHAAAAQVNLTVLLNGANSADDEDRKKLADGRDLIGELPLRISDRRGIDAIERVSAEHVADGGKLIVIDQLSMIEVAGTDSPYERTTAASNHLRMLARRLRVPILCAAQVNRVASRKKSERLDSNDLRDSGSLENDAAGVLLIDRVVEPDGPACGEIVRTLEIVVPKNRYGPTIGEGDNPIRLHWSPRTCRIDNSSRLPVGGTP